ncbi:MAG: RsmB/NOP family class I SAM-dependent RNA methyltransferase [Bdellovibrionales bacterium]|nr:RsmB/NOP family class I SAM-dependent RNA methyltransferase [Bdellovibrionales bacterium]
MKKFTERMQGVLPPEELPAFFRALDELGTRPRKSIRLRRDLAPERAEYWTPARFAELGIPLGERVPWYEHGYFFDLARMTPHPSRHPVIAAGLGFIQEAGAMEVVPELEVRADHLVLDLCAAPGAKSTHLGEYLGPGGWLVANEPDRERARLLDAILARHGIGNSTVYNLDPRRLADRFPGVFDRILVDAPCSGESLFAKRVEKRKDVSHKDVERCALRQRAILSNAWEMLAPGGRLVYSTCAYSRTENEEVVGGFREENSEGALVREGRRFPHRDGVPGGYFAVLERAGEGEPTRAERGMRLRTSVSSGGTSGLIRDGRVRWNGEIDRYVVAMDRRSGGASPSEGGVVELDFASVERFLAGEKLHAEGSVLYLWEGEPFASASGGTIHYPRGRLR